MKTFNSVAAFKANMHFKLKGIPDRYKYRLTNKDRKASKEASKKMIGIINGLKDWDKDHKISKSRASRLIRDMTEAHREYSKYMSVNTAITKQKDRVIEEIKGHIK